MDRRNFLKSVAGAAVAIPFLGKNKKQDIVIANNVDNVQKWKDLQKPVKDSHFEVGTFEGHRVYGNCSKEAFRVFKQLKNFQPENPIESVEIDNVKYHVITIDPDFAERIKRV